MTNSSSPILQLLQTAAPRPRSATVQGGVYNPGLGLANEPAKPASSGGLAIAATIGGVVVVVATVAGVIALEKDHDPNTYRAQQRAARRAR